jgi:hypothetical protein
MIFMSKCKNSISEGAGEDREMAVPEAPKVVGSGLLQKKISPFLDREASFFVTASAVTK